MKRVKVKPGKAQSAVGLAVGIIFVLIGIFIVIPTFSYFGILWTALAAVNVVTSAINVFSEKGVSTHEIIIDENSADDTEKRLTKLKEMYEKGLITYEEYENKKKDILNEI